MDKDVNFPLDLHTKYEQVKINCNEFIINPFPHQSVSLNVKPAITTYHSTSKLLGNE
jgi:hypothetical protein